MFSCVLKTPFQLFPAFQPLEHSWRNNKVLWRKWYVEEGIQRQELRENPSVFQLIPEQNLSSIRHPCYLLKGAKEPLLSLTSEITPVPAAYFPIKLLVVLLDIFPSVLGMPLKRNLCKAWGWYVCKLKHCLCAYIYTSKIYIQAGQWNTSSTGEIAKLGLESQLVQHFVICSKKILSGRHGAFHWKYTVRRNLALSLYVLDYMHSLLFLLSLFYAFQDVKCTSF